MYDLLVGLYLRQDFTQSHQIQNPCRQMAIPARFVSMSGIRWLASSAVVHTEEYTKLLGEMDSHGSLQ